MIPLTDDIRPPRVAFVNYALIAANVATFVWEVRAGDALETHLKTYGLVPARFFATEDLVARWTPFLTSMFLHGGILHVAGNLLYLHVFGDNVEGRLGHLRFLIFYLLCGLAAAGLQVAMFPRSTMPMIGASGAIAGVTGAYFVYFPRARVLTVVPVFFFPRLVRVPAVFFLFLWFALQLVYGATSLDGEGAGGGVAWWAHVGGFLGGMIAAVVLAPRRRRRS